ncbi:NAD-dependent epimerase/dehydratase family protein [Streptomyces sp. NPDC007025]|uniref:NAD-dependent epimerase/dehydratase family protein n=1 Tax=Streptomyces sp. NPDC007025 TaxID=3364771 RepID=UPI0036744FEF
MGLRPGPVGRHLRWDAASGEVNAYGRTKAAGEDLALAAGAVVLRPRAVYGVGDPHLVPRLLGRVRRGLLLLPGRDVQLSLTAVENLADVCLAAADGGWPPGAYHIADPVRTAGTRRCARCRRRTGCTPGSGTSRCRSPGRRAPPPNTCGGCARGPSPR